MKIERQLGKTFFKPEKLWKTMNDYEVFRFFFISKAWCVILLSFSSQLCLGESCAIFHPKLHAAKALSSLLIRLTVFFFKKKLPPFFFGVTLCFFLNYLQDLQLLRAVWWDMMKPQQKFIFTIFGPDREIFVKWFTWCPTVGSLQEKLHATSQVLGLE